MNESHLAALTFSMIIMNRKIGVNVDNLPDYSLRSEYAGSRDGEIKMFRKEDKGYVYKWSVVDCEVSYIG